MNVQDYDSIGEQACIEKATKSGIFIVKKDANTNKIFGLHSSVDYIEYRVNWQKNYLLDNRGGYFSYSENINNIPWRKKDKQRTEVCVEPIYGLYINYNGFVSPCCEIREDYDKHKQFIFGNLHSNSLNEILE
jgi:MoaA/NifB/PqqE/SkfB family radical SAM enzyme